MRDVDGQAKPDSDTIEGSETAPSADLAYDAIAELQASARSRHAPGGVLRPTGNHRNRNLLIVVALTAALVGGGTLVGYGISQLRGAKQRQAVEEAAKQREADLQQIQQQLAAQDLASKETTQPTAIPEGQLVSAHIATLQAMHSELDSTMSALKAKAKSSASAAHAWNQEWDRRRASYSSRYSDVSAHNARERQRYLASKVEVAKNGQLVVRYTYHPSYSGYPAKPRKPTPLSYSVDSEKKRLSVLESQINALVSSLASEATSATSFASVYKALDSTARALGATVGDASDMTRTVIVKKAKGRIIDASKISAVNLAALDAPFAELDRSFSAALTLLGLTPAQLASGAVSPQ